MILSISYRNHFSYFGWQCFLWTIKETILADSFKVRIEIFESKAMVLREVLWNAPKSMWKMILSFDSYCFFSEMPIFHMLFGHFIILYTDFGAEFDRNWTELYRFWTFTWFVLPSIFEYRWSIWDGWYTWSNDLPGITELYRRFWKWTRNGSSLFSESLGSTKSITKSVIPNS